MNDKKYKYHLFYRIYDNDEAELYACTDNDDIASRFKEERNMKRFIEKIHKVTSDEIAKITKDYPGIYLEVISGFTKKRSHGSKAMKISMVVTSNEKMSMASSYNDLVYVDFMLYARYDPALFNTEIRKALVYIDYNEWFDLYNAEDSAIGLDDYESDLLGMFLYHFGKLLDGE